MRKNYDHFTETLRFWKFLDPLSIFEISQGGKGFGSQGSYIRDQQHIIYRMIYKKGEKQNFTANLPCVHLTLNTTIIFNSWTRSSFQKSYEREEIPAS
jgi:hypothetical protein